MKRRGIMIILEKNKDYIIIEADENIHNLMLKKKK